MNWKKNSVKVKNVKNICKSDGFCEEYLTCTRFYKKNLNAETHCQHWGIGIYDLRCNAIFIYIDLTVKKGNFS